jgi:hypothetical protein
MDVDTIILLGPLGVGKSTQAKLMSDRTDQEVASYDAVKLALLEKEGFDLEECRRIRDEEGMYAMWQYGNSFSIKTIPQFISKNNNKIIDLGAADHCFDEPEQAEQIFKLFEPYLNIFLLMPSTDLATSINTLPGIKDGRQLNTYFIMHPANDLIPKHCIYTNGKSKDDIHGELFSALSQPNK